ncbi:MULTISPECIES: hypothetical protein [unclassified Streptomyces]|uniref:hypothetical protein n=1 Tax=unclassified Streptomyces TaxID=2593676 RepID=UPI002258DFBC|nr:MULTISPECIES: hypothetical protein [unclassified Streptomyces]MCX4834543.1 hypothetical protein [Streptomyces sp. NBC_01016]
MATHIRPTTPPPTRIRVATANASAAPLTGDVAFSAGNTTASRPKNAGDFVALYESANRITSAKRTSISQNTEKVGTDLDGGTVAILQGSACRLPGGTAIADSAASSHDRWGAALAASDITCHGYPMFGANAAN